MPDSDKAVTPHEFSQALSPLVKKLVELHGPEKAETLLQEAARKLGGKWLEIADTIRIVSYEKSQS